MSDLNLRLIQTYHPVSFAERGVAVPFTTPLLAGARVRPADRTGTELVVPNPSGGRGVYILPWGSARQLCRPTVHDTRLFERLGQLPLLTPSAVRSAARAIAAEGLAGRAAQAAGALAADADTNERLLANFLLLMALVEEVDPGAIPPTERLHPTADAENRAKRAVSLVAPTLGRTPELIARDLESLAVIFGPIGIPPQTEVARLPRLLATLDNLRRDTESWAAEHSDDDIAALAQMVSGGATQVIGSTQAALAQARVMTTDMTSLLRAWIRTPEVLAAQLGRADWLLDGWDRITLIWRDARWPANQRAALLEMAQLVPLPPQEAIDGAAPQNADPPDAECRVISLSDGWRTGTASFALVARNERLRARGA